MTRRVCLSILVLFTLGLALLSCGPGRGDLLVYTSGDETRHINLREKDSPTVQVTTGPSDNHSPRISPDGDLIAFVSDRDGNPDVYVMDRSGENIRKISHEVGVVSHPRWSPDGEQIAFVARTEEYDSQIYLSGVEEPDAQLLTAGGNVSGPPFWSPDGAWIAFVLTDEEGSGLGIYLRNPGGVNQIALTEGPDFSPTWSPDSDQVAFQSSRNGNDDIYVIDITEDFSDQPRRLTTNSAPDYNPTWSPDGDHIAFISERDENPEIYAAEPDGTVLRRLTNNEAEETDLVWTIDGQIAFVSHLHGNADIYIMDVEGEAQEQVTSHPGPDTQPHG